MPKRSGHLLVLIWFLLYGPPCFAPDPEGFIQFDLPDDPDVKRHGFLVPNELYPQDGESIFKAAGAGAYITVGTERGFIHFGLTPAATHLVLVDTDPDVARFNRINRMLLAASTSRADYLRLRVTDTAEVWKAAAGRDGGKVKLDGLLSEDEFKFWHDTRVFKPNGKLEERERFVFLEKPSGDTVKREYFAKGNYLYDDGLYERLAKAAKEGRIQVENFSLKNSKNFRAMMSKLKAKGIALSVFDMSNAWWQSFMPKAEMESLLQVCAENRGPKSVFLATDRLKGGLKNYETQLPLLSARKRKGWVYLGFTFDMIDAIGGTGPFMDFMFLDTDRPERLAVLNALNREPYQHRVSCERSLVGTAPIQSGEIQ